MLKISFAGQEILYFTFFLLCFAFMTTCLGIVGICGRETLEEKEVMCSG